MKIALIHTRLIRRGGLESRLFLYMELLRKMGHEVTIFVFKVDPSISLPPDVSLEHINLKTVPKPFRQVLFDRLVARQLAKGEFDHVISMGRTSSQDVMIVGGNHLAYLSAVKKPWKGLKDYLQIYLDHKAYRSPGILFACSEMLKEEMLHHSGVESSKVRVLYPPSDVHRFHSGLKTNYQQWRRKYGFDPDKKSFLLVSSDHRRKGLPLLLEVFAKLDPKRVELLVAGGQAVKTNLPHVRSLGFVQEVEELNAAADFSLLPSRYDPFGQVVSESLLCGTPAIVSHMTGAKALINSSNGRVVPSFQAEDWVHTIQESLDYPFEVRQEEVLRNGIDPDQHIQVLLYPHKKSG